MKQPEQAGTSKNYLNAGSSLILFLIFAFTGSQAWSQDPTDIIKGKWLIHTDAQNSLYNHLTEQAYNLLEQRSGALSAITTAGEWTERQKFIKNTLNEIAGPFPDRTPLNANVVRTIDKKSYRIEHIIFESQPGFYVTSSMFLPSGIKKGSRLPAVIYCSGHSEEGYRSAVYQHVILNLVKKGFIVFAFDPVGQGERLEYYDPATGKSSVGGPTREHSYPGAQAFITGSSQAKYMIWDGIRAVDYLLTRKEVDPSRIGITGRSGGGTQSAYIAAFDERIYAAAPENYITNYKRLLESIGPQDAEQNLFHSISEGLDHPDFLIVRAPKPALMITTTGDMFSIQGAIETEREVTRIYKALGKPGNFSRVEDDAGHASTLKNREAMYAFFQEHLKNPGSPADEVIPLPGPDELRVTGTGQVSTSLKSETVFSLNRKEAGLKENILKELRDNDQNFQVLAVNSAKDLSGYRQPEPVDEPVFSGRIIREGYSIDKYFVKGEGDYIIPYLLFIPENPGHDYLIYLHPAGKSAEASPGGEIGKFIKKGFTVLAPDLLGAGEMGPGSLKGDASFDGVSHNVWYASMLIGRSITGIQAGDVVRLAMLIKRSDSDATVAGFARKEMSSVLLHSAAFSQTIERVILAEPFSSFNSIVSQRFYKHSFILTTVPGAPGRYDLPDLAASLAPRRLIIAGPTDGNGKNEDRQGIMKDLEIIRRGYLLRKASDNLIILQDMSTDTVIDLATKPE